MLQRASSNINQNATSFLQWISHPPCSTPSTSGNAWSNEAWNNYTKHPDTAGPWLLNNEPRPGSIFAKNTNTTPFNHPPLNRKTVPEEELLSEASLLLVDSSGGQKWQRTIVLTAAETAKQSTRSKPEEILSWNDGKRGGGRQRKEFVRVAPGILAVVHVACLTSDSTLGKHLPLDHDHLQETYTKSDGYVHLYFLFLDNSTWLIRGRNLPGAVN